MTFQITLCNNTACSQPVPPSLNKGVVRKFCSYACASRMHQKNYRERYRGSSGQGMLGVINGHPFVRRQKARNAKEAEGRFKRHMQECMLSENKLCPGRVDPYDRRRLCMIRAVLREDWDQLRRAENGRTWERELTTENGFWIDAPAAVVAEINNEQAVKAASDIVAFKEANEETYNPFPAPGVAVEDPFPPL